MAPSSHVVIYEDLKVSSKYLYNIPFGGGGSHILFLEGTKAESKRHALTRGKGNFCSGVREPIRYSPFFCEP